ncbi:MAG: aminotransferase, partial [Flavobacteriales bacterium]|nr:aminotransferase [Flavobacteriales bacterium]
YKEGANRYSVGEMSNFNLVPMLTKTIEQILEWTPTSIQKYCGEITKEAIEELRLMHCFIEEDDYQANHLFGVKLADNMDVNRLQEEFKDNNIFVSVRGEYIRVSPHVFNTKEDLQKLVNCFRLCVSF